MDDELFTETDVPSPSKRSRRGKAVAVSVALAGVLLVVGTGAAFAIQAGQSAIDNINTGESPQYVPLSERDAGESAQLINPTPTTTTAAGLRTNGYGTPLYDVNSDPSLIVYPESMPDDLRKVAELVVDQNFITAKCMADQGFDYVFALDWERTAADKARANGFNEGPREGTPEYTALWGTTERGAAYRWEDAGCNGYAVHVTGMDGQH